jgi:hypothetical protein
MSKVSDKAVFIDVHNQSVSEIMVPRENRLQELYDVLGCSMVQRTTIDPSHDLIIDEEGLFKEDNPAFAMGGYMFVGNALIMGVDLESGEWTDHEIDIERLSGAILFPSEEETRRIFERSQENQEDNIIVD